MADPRLEAVQKQIQQLITLALRSPEAQEGRTAAMAACRLLRESGLLVVRPDELVTFVTAEAAKPAKKARKPKAPRVKKDLTEVVSETADGFVTAVDAAGRIVSSFNGFRDVLRR